MEQGCPQASNPSKSYRSRYASYRGGVAALTGYDAARDVVQEAFAQAPREPNVDYEVEIYDPSPAVALATAMSGDVRPVS